jgi:hypothetical protein
MISRAKFDAYPIEVRARIELSECALRLYRLKWWEFKKRKALLSHIELVSDFHVHRTLEYFSFLDHK